MWLPVDLVLAALLSSAFELAWVAERGGLSADGDPSDLDTDSSYVPALAPSPAPAFSSRRRVMARARASAHRPHSRAGRPGGRRGRRSNRCTDWRLVTATRPGTQRRPQARRRPPGPRARAQPGAPDAYAPIWLLPRIVRTCHDTATCPRQNCLHAQRRPRRAHGGNLHPLSPKKRRYGRFSTISRAAQPSSRAPEPFSRPDPGAATPRPSKSAARWSAAIATASRRSPGPPRPTCSSATSMPIELGRRSTSSTNDGRRTPDVLRPGPPRRLPAPTRRTPRRRRDPQTRSPRVRVSARRGFAVWRDHDDESAASQYGVRHGRASSRRCRAPGSAAPTSTPRSRRGEGLGDGAQGRRRACRPRRRLLHQAGDRRRPV